MRGYISQTQQNFVVFDLYILSFNTCRSLLRSCDYVRLFILFIPCFIDKRFTTQPTKCTNLFPRYL